MKSGVKLGVKSGRRAYQACAVLAIFLGLVAACSKQPEATTAPTIAPTAVLSTVAATLTPTATDEAADIQPTLATANESASPAANTAGLPEPLAALLLNADVVRGDKLTVQNGCTACHSLDKDMKIIGPSFYDVGQVAGERVAGESAELYLYNSIIHPNQYIVETFLPGLMPQTFAEQLSEQDLADVIAYLLSRQDE